MQRKNIEDAKASSFFNYKTEWTQKGQTPLRPF